MQTKNVSKATSSALMSRFPRQKYNYNKVLHFHSLEYICKVTINVKVRPGRQVTWNIIKSLTQYCSHNWKIKTFHLLWRYPIIQKKNICTRLLAAALSEIAKYWKQPKYPKTGECSNSLEPQQSTMNRLKIRKISTNTEWHSEYTIKWKKFQKSILSLLLFVRERKHSCICNFFCLFYKKETQIDQNNCL